MPFKAVLILILLIAFFTVSAWFAFAASDSSGRLTAAERAQLEAQLAELEKQITETEGIISTYKQQGDTLKKEINRLNSEISKTNLQIKAINLELNRLDDEIEINYQDVLTTEKRLELQKNALRAALQNIYEQETETIIEILLQSPTLSHFFTGVNNLLDVQASLNSTLEKTIVLRGQLLDNREHLALQKSDKESLKSYQNIQKKELQSKQGDKANLLEVTKGEESKYQELLQTTKKTAAEIRNRIFEFLGGGQLTFEEAFKLAKAASNLTGIRPALILAVLDKESALGANVGQCNYKEAMHPRRDIPVFLEIVQELGISPDSVTVSCPISYDGAYGGAMGPAQFIPSTWDIYKNRIAELTGNNPPSPWRHFDAFVGTALYLVDARSSQACVNYSREIPSQADILLDRCAAAKYYAGSRWYSYRWTYGERVIKKAAQFEEDIARISS